MVNYCQSALEMSSVQIRNKNILMEKKCWKLEEVLKCEKNVNLMWVTVKMQQTMKWRCSLLLQFSEWTEIYKYKILKEKLKDRENKINILCRKNNKRVSKYSEIISGKY